MQSLSADRSNRCDTSETVPSLPAQVCHERYSALMKHTKHIPLLLALVLMASVTFAQTTDGQAADSAPAENAISAARSRYTTDRRHRVRRGQHNPGAASSRRIGAAISGPARVSPRNIPNAVEGSWKRRTHLDRGCDRIRSWSCPRRQPERSQRNPSRRRNHRRGWALWPDRRMRRQGCRRLAGPALCVCISQKNLSTILA